MEKLTPEEFEKKLAQIPEEAPDEWDLALLASIDRTEEMTSLEEVRALRECNGKISVRVPRELHYKLLKRAKANGVSLNQFIMYKLAE